MGRIEEIMSQDKDIKGLYEKARELVEYYKDQLKDHTYIEIFEGYKKLKFSKSFEEQYQDVPERYKIAISIAMEELMKEKLKELKPNSPEMNEILEYFDKELEEAKKVYNEMNQFLQSEEEERQKIVSELKPEDNYTRYAVAYQNNSIDENGRMLIENNKKIVRSNVAADTIKLINAQKKNINK